MKFLIFIFFILLFFNKTALAKPIELVCTPDTEWDSSFKKEKIWIKYNKPKFFVSVDLNELQVKKLSFSKKKKKYSNVVNVPLEKFPEKNGMYSYKFVKAGELVANELYVYNLISILESNYGFGIYVEQYRLNNNQIDQIEKKMDKFTFSEFEKSRKDYQSKNLELIKYFGGMSGLCD